MLLKKNVFVVQVNRLVAQRISTTKKFIVCENLSADVVFVAIIMTCLIYMLLKVMRAPSRIVLH